MAEIVDKMYTLAWIQIFNPLAVFFAFLIPVLVLMYLLKQKREDLQVGSILLWQKVVEDIQANTPFQKLRRNLLLLLQVLILMFLIFSLMRPMVKREGIPAKAKVIIVDCSASMKTVENDGKTRFEMAKEEVSKLIEQMESEDKMMIIECSDQVRQVQSFTNNRQLLHNAVKKLKAVDTSCNFQDSLVLAAAAIKNYPASSAIVIYSDGAVGNYYETEEIYNKVVFQKIGESENNVAITMFNISLLPFESDDIIPQYGVFARFHNYSKFPRECELNLYAGEERKLIDTEIVTIENESDFVHEFQTEIPSGIIQYEVVTDDDLKTDNIAYSYVSSTPRLRIVLVSDEYPNTGTAADLIPGNPVIKKLLNSSPEYVELVTSCSSDDFPPEEEFDLAIFDSCVPYDADQYSFLSINPPKDIGIFKVEGDIRIPKIIDWSKDHLYNRNCDYSNLVVLNAKKITPEGNALVLLDSLEGPLIATNNSGGKRQVVIAFEPRDCDPAWDKGGTSFTMPLFFWNVLNMIRTESTTGFPGQVSCGSPITIPKVEKEENISVTLPDGSVKDYKVDDVILSIDCLREVGIYKINYKGEDVYTCANILSEVESNIIPKKLFDYEIQIEENQESIKENSDIWPYLVFAILAISILEWIAYHRRWG